MKHRKFGKSIRLSGDTQIDDKIILHRHAQMLKRQKDVYPFALSVMQLGELWGVYDVEIIYQTLRQMRDKSLVNENEYEGRLNYYAVERN